MGEGRRRCRSGPWDEGAGGVHKEGGEEAAHVPTGVTYVAEEHSFLVKGTLAHLALCIIRGEAVQGGNEGRYGCGRP